MDDQQLKVIHIQLDMLESLFKTSDGQSGTPSDEPPKDEHSPVLNEGMFIWFHFTTSK